MLAIMTCYAPADNLKLLLLSLVFNNVIACVCDMCLIVCY